MLSLNKWMAALLICLYSKAKYYWSSTLPPIRVSFLLPNLNEKLTLQVKICYYFKNKERVLWKESLGSRRQDCLVQVFDFRTHKTILAFQFAFGRIRRASAEHPRISLQSVPPRRTRWQRRDNQRTEVCKARWRIQTQPWFAHLR